MSVGGLALQSLYPQIREVYHHWRLEVTLPSFQAYMENTKTAHNHLSKSDIFPDLVCLYMLFKKNIIIQYGLLHRLGAENTYAHS